MNFYELQEYFKSNELGNVKKENDSYVRVMSSNVLTSADGKQQASDALPYEKRIDYRRGRIYAYCKTEAYNSADSQRGDTRNLPSLREP